MCSSEIFSRVEWWFVSNVSERTIGSILKGQAVEEETVHTKLVA
jgi:hypothetical protein